MMGKTAGDDPHAPSTTCRPADDHCYLRRDHRSLRPRDIAVSQRIQPKSLYVVSGGFPVLSDGTVLLDAQLQLQVVLWPVAKQSGRIRLTDTERRGNACHGRGSVAWRADH